HMFGTSHDRPASSTTEFPASVPIRAVPTVCAVRSRTRTSFPPAASRIAKLSTETPAQFVAFDLLAADGSELLDLPFDERRDRLERLATGMADPLFVTRTTLDVDLAREWLTTFEGAGLDGVVAKPRAKPYEPNKRSMLKVKHHRTADVVAMTAPYVVNWHVKDSGFTRSPGWVGFQ
ncbi:hypothetical protein IAE22_30255, partial [Bacillus sp. S34]|nr:hypothetical protein [Bacillus sp. S34]